MRSLARKGLEIAGQPLGGDGGSNSSSGGGRGGGGGATAAAAAGAGGQTSGLGPSARVQLILQRLRRFMEEHVYPAGKSRRAA